MTGWVLPEGYLPLLLLGGSAAGLGAAWLLLRGSAPVGAARCSLAAAWAAAVSLVQYLLAVELLGANLFALVMLAWVGLGLLAPACALLVALRAWARATGPTRTLVVLALAGVPVNAWATLVEPTQLVVERPQLELPPAREGLTPLRIGVLADLQVSRVGAHEHAAVQALLAEEPDLILIPGDLFQGPMSAWPQARDDLRALLGELEAPGGVFVVAGNSDYGAGVPELLEGTRCELLVNRPVEVQVRDRRVVVLGLADAGFPRRVVASFEERAAADPGAVHLVLVHRPGTGVQSLAPDTPVDLVVGGHTHGGQVVLPGLGPPLTLSTLPRRVAAGGLHRLDGRTVHVSRGVGMERKWAPRVRLLCPPEVTVLTLR